MEYIPGIQFQTSLVNMKEAKSLTTRNQPERSNKSGSDVDPEITYELLQIIALWDLKLEGPKNWPWGWGYLNLKQTRQKKMHKQRKRANVWWKRPLGRLQII